MVISKYRPIPRNIDSLGITAKNNFFKMISKQNIPKILKYEFEVFYKHVAHSILHKSLLDYKLINTMEICESKEFGMFYKNFTLNFIKAFYTQLKKLYRNATKTFKYD